MGGGQWPGPFHSPSPWRERAGVRGESFAPATVPYGGNALTLILSQRERGHVSENEKTLVSGRVAGGVSVLRDSPSPSGRGVGACPGLDPGVRDMWRWASWLVHGISPSSRPSPLREKG